MYRRGTSKRILKSIEGVRPTGKKLFKADINFWYKRLSEVDAVDQKLTPVSACEPGYVFQKLEFGWNLQRMIVFTHKT